MKKPLHPVSDHAVIRYLERVQGIDVDAIRCEIGRTVDRAVQHGASAAISGGYVYKMRCGVVVTVLDQHRRDHRTCRKRKRP